jgi:hypothetical protein
LTQPIYGIDETGFGQMMFPGIDYQFPGNTIYETPMAKFQNGGAMKRVKIHSLPKAQQGIPNVVRFQKSPSNPATFQDSIDVGNASQKAMDWYMANGYFNRSDPRFVNPRDPQINIFPENAKEWKPSEKGPAHASRISIGGKTRMGQDDLGQGGVEWNNPNINITIPAGVNQFVDDAFSGVGNLVGEGIAGTANLLKGEQLAQWINDNQFWQYGDEHSRILNTDAPRILYDKRIQPRTNFSLQGTAPGYFSGNADIVDLPIYEKWYTTPWSLLSAEDKRKRLEYGILDGTPFKDWNDTRLIQNYPDIAIARGGRRTEGYDKQTISNAAKSGYAATQEGAALYEKNKWGKNPMVYDAQTIANAAKSGYPATQSGAAEYDQNKWAKKPKTRSNSTSGNGVYGTINEVKKEPNANTDIGYYMRTELGLDKKQSSYSERKKLAEKYGIKDYSGTGKQNIELLNKIKSESNPRETVINLLSGKTTDVSSNTGTSSGTATSTSNSKEQIGQEDNKSNTGKKLEQTVQSGARENYSLHETGNGGGAAYLYRTVYDENGEVVHGKSGNMGVVLTEDYLTPDQQKEFDSIAGGTARVDFNPNARMWHDLRQPLDIIEEQRGTRKKALEMQKRNVDEVNAEKAAYEQYQQQQRDQEKARLKKVQEEIEAEKKAGGYAYGGAVDPEKPWRHKSKSKDGNYLYNRVGTNAIQDYANSSVRRTLKGFITGAPKPTEAPDTKYVPAKFQNGGDIPVPNLRRVKIHALPKAQDGTSLTRMTDEDLERIRAIEDKPEQTTFYITPDKKTNELIGQVQFNPDTADAFKTLVDSPDKKLRVVNYPYGYSYMAPGHIEAAAWDTANNQPINSIGNSQTRVNRWDSGNLRVDGNYEDPSKVRTADLNLNPARLAQFLKYSNTPQDYNFLMDNCADGVCRALGMDPRLYTTLGITDPARVMDHVINSGEFNPTNVQGRRVDIPEGLGTIFDNEVQPYIDKGYNYGKQIIDDAWNQHTKLLKDTWDFITPFKEGGGLDKYQRKGQVKLNIPGNPLNIPANLQQKKLPTPSINFNPQLGIGINIPDEYKHTFDLRPRPKAAPTAPANENVFSDFDFKKMNQDLISGSAVAESTRPANMWKPPIEWEGKSIEQITAMIEAQKIEAERQRELDSRDVLTADTKSDSEKLARKAWTAISHPMETLAAVSRGYSIPYGYMGMHNPYDGLGIGSPMTSIVDMAAGIPGFIANAAYRQGEQIVDHPGEYFLEQTLGLFDPKSKAVANWLDLAAAVPAVRGIPRLPNQISNYTTKVGRQLSEIERRGAALGLNDFEIAQKQLSDVGITANQRRGYVPGASELFNKYVTPFGYEGAGQSKLAQTFNNIKTSGWEAPRRAAMGNITAETSAAEANAIRNAHRDLNIRDDAWRTYLGMPQKNFTFNMANTAPAMHPAYKPGSLAGMDIYNIPENRIFGTGFDEVTNTIGPRYSLREAGMDPLNKPILLDRDPILMGGYNKVLTKDGLQYNDIWDLDPTINFSSLVPKSVKKVMPEKWKEKLFYKDVPISRAQTHPGHTSSGYNNQPLIVTQPRQMKIPVSKFIGKPFMSHGNLNYTSGQYVNDLSQNLRKELELFGPEGSKGIPMHLPAHKQALDLEYKLDLLNSGAYPKYKSGGGVKRVKINALPNNWKSQ